MSEFELSKNAKIVLSNLESVARWNTATDSLSSERDYRQGFEDGCAHMKEDFEAGMRLDKRRADLSPTLEQLEADPRVKALVEAAQNAAIALAEAEDKFHVLSFYINDDASLKCAKERIEWMRASRSTINTALATFTKEPKE